MKTITACVEDIIASQPFIEEALSQNIINYSALANNLRAPISQMLRKDIKSGAIMMALRRYNHPLNFSKRRKLQNFFNGFGDIIVRSDLCDFTFKNSKSLMNCHTKILESIGAKNHIFYGFTRGLFESTIIISSSESQFVKEAFKDEEQIGMQDKLSAISISLPKGNSKVVGLYYHIFKRLAWEGVSLYEVISTTNEFTVLVEDNLVDKAFAVIKNLKN